MNATLPQLILYQNLNVVIAGNGNRTGNVLQNVQDLLSVRVNNVHFCSKVLNGFTNAQHFDFDLDTLERKYHLEDPNTDHCKSIGSAGKDNPANAILSYLSNLKTIAPDPSPIDPRKAKKFLNFVEPVEDQENRFEAVLTLHDSVSIEFAYFGDYDEDGRFHGQAVLDTLNDETCYKGNCHVNEFSRIFATFHHGLVQGLV